MSTCLIARCGDGVVQEGVEACDDGNDDNTDACWLGVKLRAAVMAFCKRVLKSAMMVILSIPMSVRIFVQSRAAVMAFCKLASSATMVIMPDRWMSKYLRPARCGDGVTQTGVSNVMMRIVSKPMAVGVV